MDEYEPGLSPELSTIFQEYFWDFVIRVSWTLDLYMKLQDIEQKKV